MTESNWPISESNWRNVSKDPYFSPENYQELVKTFDSIKQWWDVEDSLWELIAVVKANLGGGTLQNIVRDIVLKMVDDDVPALLPSMLLMALYRGTETYNDVFDVFIHLLDEEAAEKNMPQEYIYTKYANTLKSYVHWPLLERAWSNL